MITTHVLDIARGEPADGVTVILELRQASEWTPDRPRHHRRQGARDDAHRRTPLAPGTYRLTFDIGTYHRELGLAVPFFPEVKITFNVRDPDEHYHLPLLLSPFGYTHLSWSMIR